MDFSHGYINATMEITVQVWSLPHVTLTITSSFILSITSCTITCPERCVSAAEKNKKKFVEHITSTLPSVHPFGI